MTTYTKLRSGEWGLRIQGSARVGQAITVTKKSGETKTEYVRNIIWAGNGITLAAIDTMDRPAGKSYQPRRRSGRYECSECGEYHTEGDGTHCWEDGHAH